MIVTGSLYWGTGDLMAHTFRFKSGSAGSWVVDKAVAGRHVTGERLAVSSDSVFVAGGSGDKLMLLKYAPEQRVDRTLEQDGGDMQDRAKPKRAVLVVAALVAVVSAALFAAAAPPPAAAYDYSPASGTLLWRRMWHPSSIFMKYGERDLVRGPGGDIWLGITGSTSALDTPYIKRVCVARYLRRARRSGGTSCRRR